MEDKQNSQIKRVVSDKSAGQTEPEAERSFDELLNTPNQQKNEKSVQAAAEFNESDSSGIFAQESEKYPDNAGEYVTLSFPEIQTQPEIVNIEKTSTPQNFADILDTLRTEEDSFYFVVKEGRKAAEEKIILESAETPIGADDRGAISFDIKKIKTIFAVARKDWSGILIESQRNNSIFVNEEAVETTKRLRNDDKISFASPLRSATLLLHEPSLLVALEPMLSDNRAAAELVSGDSTAADRNKILDAGAAAPHGSLLERNYIGYFSFTEIVTMFIVTMIGAVLFFLLFEFIFP